MLSLPYIPVRSLHAKNEYIYIYCIIIYNYILHTYICIYNYIRRIQTHNPAQIKTLPCHSLIPGTRGSKPSTLEYEILWDEKHLKGKTEPNRSQTMSNMIKEIICAVTTCHVFYISWILADNPNDGGHKRSVTMVGPCIAATGFEWSWSCLVSLAILVAYYHRTIYIYIYILYII